MVSAASNCTKRKRVSEEKPVMQRRIDCMFSRKPSATTPPTATGEQEKRQQTFKQPSRKDCKLPAAQRTRKSATTKSSATSKNVIDSGAIVVLESSDSNHSSPVKSGHVQSLAKGKRGRSPGSISLGSCASSTGLMTESDTCSISTPTPLQDPLLFPPLMSHTPETPTMQLKVEDDTQGSTTVLGGKSINICQ